MAKYVLLTFDEDDAADQFVEAAQKHDLRRLVGDYIEEAEWVDCTVRAVYKKPTKFCTGTDKPECRGHKKGFTRGTKYGWWVCAACGKPTQAWGDGEHWYATHGKNLLPKTVEAPEYRGGGDYSIPALKQTEPQGDEDPDLPRAVREAHLPDSNG